MFDLAIKGGWVVDPVRQEIRKQNIYVKDGRIAALGESDENAQETRDASGLYVLPGCIDTHCHFRDPGATEKEDFAHGTRAAAVGGITTVLDMPNTNPAVLDGVDVRKKIAYFHDKAYVDYGIWGLSLGDLNLDKLLSIKEAGAAAIKFFWGYAIAPKTHALVYNYTKGKEDVIPPLDDGEVYAIFRQIAANRQILAIHAENSALIRRLTEELDTSKTADDDYAAFLSTRPSLAEELTVATAISMARDTGAHLHILHMTSRRGVELVRRAKAEGVSVTAETAPHYLFLSAEDFPAVGPMMKVYPLIKSKDDQAALWAGLLDGTLDFVASDHAPHRIEEKRGSLFKMPSGMCGVETMLPLMLDAVSRGKITLPFVARVLSQRPAEIYGIERKGKLEIGFDADLVLVDMQKTRPIRNEDLHSKQPLTAFDGRSITGWPVSTYLRGRLIAADHEIVGDPGGQAAHFRAAI